MVFEHDSIENRIVLQNKSSLVIIAIVPGFGVCPYVWIVGWISYPI